jgi:Phosphoglycerol transferase and related proteins, alkaline phosphatase superfamily
MKKQNNLNVKNSYLKYIEAAILITLFAVKAFFLYDYIDYGKYSIIYAAATAGALIGLYAIISWITDRGAALWTLLGVYFLFTFFMFCDRMYFSYYGKMPSFAMLGMVSMLSGVSSTVHKLMDYTHLLYIADLPIIAIYYLGVRRFIAKREIGIRAARISSRINRAVSTALFLALGFAVALGVKLTDLKLNNLESELFLYHITDAGATMFGGKTVGSVDTGSYVQAFAKTDDTSPYYGLAQGRNLIIIQVESLQGFVINNTFNGQEITPNLNALIKDNSFYFPNYYYIVGAGNTSDAEFTVNNSLYPPTDTSAYVKYTDKDYYGLPFVLKDNGYKTADVFHGYLREYWNRDKAYPYQGFDNYYSKDTYSTDDIIGLGVSDEKFFSESVDILKTKEQPFYAFMITLSSHNPFSLPQNKRMLKVPAELDDTLFANYFEAINYTDYAIGQLMNNLKEAGLYDNSVIVIYGDHYGMPNDAENYSLASNYFGHLYYENDLFRVPMIIHIPGSGVTKTVTRASSHIDVMPTVLNLLGIKNTGGVMFGHDMLSDDTTPVYEQMHVKTGSFVTNDVFFVYPTSGILSEAKIYDLSTGNRIDDGTAATAEKYADYYNAALKVHEDCTAIIESNNIRTKAVP